MYYYNTAVQSEKGVSSFAIKNFHFEKNKKCITIYFYSIIYAVLR